MGFLWVNMQLRERTGHCRKYQDIEGNGSRSDQEIVISIFSGIIQFSLDQVYRMSRILSGISPAIILYLTPCSLFRQFSRSVGGLNRGMAGMGKPVNRPGGLLGIQYIHEPLGCILIHLVGGLY
jgi:hypothetical protein